MSCAYRKQEHDIRSVLLSFHPERVFVVSLIRNSSLIKRFHVLQAVAFKVFFCSGKVEFGTSEGCCIRAGFEFRARSEGKPSALRDALTSLWITFAPFCDQCLVKIWN